MILFVSVRIVWTQLLRSQQLLRVALNLLLTVRVRYDNYGNRNKPRSNNPNSITNQ
jgi:hypothetical protein